MTFSKSSHLNPGKKNRCKVFGEEEMMGCKRFKTDLSSIMGDTSSLNRSRIYNIGIRKKPAELFRKDLISAMKLPDSDQLNPEEYLLITDTWKEEWEKGVQVPVNPDSLPDSSIVRVLNESQVIRPPPSPTTTPRKSAPKGSSPAKKSSPSKPSSSPSKVVSKDKDTSPFKMPSKRLEFEPDRDVAASRYEIDVTDLSWLQALKESEEGIVIQEDMMEEVMNELEYQCARNMKNKHVGIEFDDHIVCDICRSPDAEDENEMVFCDSCNICVHQACYGIAVIPDGEWMCSPCQEMGSHKKAISCVLCPNSGGAFKPTSNGRWAHVSCALWVPEVSIGCVTSMEPITKIKSIPASRWNLVCSFCGIKQGAPIQCSVSTCKVAYHVTCAFNHHLKLKAVVEEESKGVKLKSYCSKHSENEGKDSVKDERNSSESDSYSDGSSMLNNNNKVLSGRHEIEIKTTSNTDSDKNNRFWMYIDINEINQTLIPKFSKQFSSLSPAVIQLYIDLIQQYWKMKRTSNYGLPLIKVVTADTIEEIQNAHRNDILRLRVNLERIRNLSYMIIRREKTKRSWLTTHRSIVEKALSIASGVDLPSLISSQETDHLLEETNDRLTVDSKMHPLSQQHLPDFQPFVSPDEIFLAQNVINSNIIYNPETEVDKLRFKRVTRELNRLVKVNHLRRREPNPYERPYLKQRTPSTSSRDGSTSGDTNRQSVVKLMNGPSSPHKNHVHNNNNHSNKGFGSPSKNRSPQSHDKINGIKRIALNGSSLLIKKNPLTPKKNSSSSAENLKQASLLLKNNNNNRHRMKQSKTSPSQLKMRNNHIHHHSHSQSILSNSRSPSKTSGKSSPHKKSIRRPVTTRVSRDKAMNGVMKGHDEDSFEDDHKQGCIIS